jgi:hypothetical protein
MTAEGTVERLPSDSTVSESDAEGIEITLPNAQQFFFSKYYLKGMVLQIRPSNTKKTTSSFT